MNHGQTKQGTGRISTYERPKDIREQHGPGHASQSSQPLLPIRLVDKQAHVRRERAGLVVDQVQLNNVHCGEAPGRVRCPRAVVVFFSAGSERAHGGGLTLVRGQRPVVLCLGQEEKGDEQHQAGQAGAQTVPAAGLNSRGDIGTDHREECREDVADRAEDHLVSPALVQVERLLHHERAQRLALAGRQAEHHARCQVPLI